MNNPLLSHNWYRVAELKPRLRTHVQLHRHRYRDAVWYLLQDPVSGRIHRFSPAARLMIAAMNGERTVAQLWELLNRELADEAPTQDEVINLLGQLHAADLLQSDMVPDAAELFERAQKEKLQQLKKNYLNPMAIRFSLWDPEPFLQSIQPLLKKLWNRWAFVAWLAVLLPALLLLPMHWGELSHNLSDRVLAVDNLLLLLLVFPLLKALHELGHAAAVKAGGGEVHEMGVLLLVLMPVPFVDANAANAFKSKYERIVVGAAGMAVELFIAAIAFYLWLLVEPGLFKAVLFNVMLVAGVSTILFNGNPLLRYDAYYMLADAVEIPNLAGQSLRYWMYLLNRYIYRVEDAEPPPSSRAERRWFLFYGPASMFYRIWVAVVIALFIATQFFIVGVVLALWALVTMLLMPLWKGIKYLLDSPRLAQQRSRAVAITASVTMVMFAFLMLVPMPFRSTTEGVVSFADEAMVRSQAEGFLDQVLLAPGSAVVLGQPLFRLSNPELQAKLTETQARVAELEASYLAEAATSVANGNMLQEQLKAEQAALAHIQAQVNKLTVTAKSVGTFVVPQVENLSGRYFHKGDVLAYVMTQQQPVVRVVVEQSLIDVVRVATDQVWLRHAHQPEQVIAGRIVRQVPAAQTQLPSRALSTEGGGVVSLDPRDPQGSKTMQRLFQLDIALPASSRPVFFGERVYVRFDHQYEPLAVQWYRGLRTLFLSHFKV